MHKNQCLPLLMGVFLFSCNDQTKPSKEVTTDTIVAPVQKAPQPGLFIVDGDSLIIPSFEVELSLSPKAKQRIVGSGETIVMDAFYSGEPKDTIGVKVAEDGEYYIANARKEIKYGETVRFESVKFPRKQYEFLANKDIDVLINVYTGRHTTSDNLLDCEILSDKISKLMGKKFTLKGKLIYGDD